MHITRRTGLAMGLGAVLGACGGGEGGSGSGGGAIAVVPTPTPSATPTPTPTPTPTATAQAISVAAASRNMRFGSTFAWNTAGADAGSFANPSYAALLEGQCQLLVPENELKWQAIRPTATTFDFTRADAMLAYAQSRNLAMRGHTLLWYVAERFPAWLAGYDFGTAPRTEALRIIREHVQTVARHYGTAIASYDVVNEAIDPATGTLRTNSLAQAVGGDTSVIDTAYLTARAELPGAQLVYNDYMDWGTGSTHRDGVLALLRGFRDRGVPVDALGIQSHLSFPSATQGAADLVAAGAPRLRAFLDAVTAMGYDLVVTELDVNDVNRPGDAATRDVDVATVARGWLDVVMGYRQLRDVLVWGMSDRYSWLQMYKRGDGTLVRPDPFDSAFARKPMADAIAAAFTATAAR